MSGNTNTTVGAFLDPNEHPLRVTTLLSILGYALVAASFGGVIPYPSIDESTVNLLSHAIAAINTVALASILAGFYWIRNGEVEKHKKAMLTAFALILVFLVLYLVKVGAGFEKKIAVEGIVWTVYVVMLAVHIVLSAVSVPVVIHAVVLGLTNPVEEIPETSHPRVGRIAAAAWSVSLALGIVTYLLLNHVYGYTI
ncbi:MAG: DUF420 domain-containing protein [Halobacteria archaeon]|nr:DUF420 domain-containing protein [Halobacteria archaeon]